MLTCLLLAATSEFVPGWCINLLRHIFKVTCQLLEAPWNMTESSDWSYAPIHNLFISII